MDDDVQKPKTQPAGDRPPPRPPRRTAVGLGPEEDDSESRGPATIRMAATGEGKFIRESEGRGQYGHVLVKLAPLEKNQGVEILSDVSPDAIPEGYVKSAIEGIRLVFEHDKLVDIVAHVTGGTHHEIYSSDMAFKMAGIFAAKDALKAAEIVEVK